jgi:hypothetical protein
LISWLVGAGGGQGSSSAAGHDWLLLGCCLAAAAAVACAHITAPAVPCSPDVAATAVQQCSTAHCWTACFHGQPTCTTRRIGGGSPWPSSQQRLLLHDALVV